MIRDVTAAFRGITTPIQELYQRIADAGWELQSVDFKNDAYVAKAKSPHGEKVEKTGITDATAVANVLVAILRRHQMRTATQYKIGMWKTNFTDQLQPIAEAYAQMPVYDPKAAAAWKELADDSVHRAQVLGQQLKIEIVDEPEPYTSAQEMCNDVHQNQKFKVSRANSHHPIWTVDQNVAFRIVHDVMGHCVSGGDFGWQGENLACAAHFPLLSANAQQALFVECIAQTAYAAYYRSFGPQKVALLPQFLSGAQGQENDPTHTGIHPSQSVAPVAMPQAQASPPVGLPTGDPAPHEVGLGVWSKIAAERLTDPNAGFSSGIEPMEPNAYLHHGDPLEAKPVMDNAAKINTDWHTMDSAMARQAIVNAFRVVLLSPRKDLRWNAVHYQDINHIPADVKDPKVYWDALEARRRSWNQAQGIDPEAHMPYYKFVKPFQSIIMQQHPHMTFKDGLKKAEQILYEWLQQEEQRIEAEDSDKPAEKQRPADEIERRANEALAKRLQIYIKAQFDPRTDQVADQPGLFSHIAAGQYNMFTGEEGGKYGAWMGAHLKAIARISEHVDELLQAALEDVHDHDGAGHHFRAKVLQLGVSGVGPKVASFAWLLLQPLTSQLATIDTHMMDVLGHKYEKEMNDRDYFRFERELAAGRDAAGYSHIPLGTFQWGMWDHKRTGPGTHQDHSALRVLNPVPHTQVDWASKVTNLKGDSWLKQAPDWWQNTQPARQAVADDWDANVAPNFSRSSYPWQVYDDPEQHLAGSGMRVWKGVTLHDGTEHRFDGMGYSHLGWMEENGIVPDQVAHYWTEDETNDRVHLDMYKDFYRENYRWNFSKIADHTGKGFKYWWDREKPIDKDEATKMAEYAVASKLSRSKAKDFLDNHKDDVRGDFEGFKKAFFKKFDRIDLYSKVSAALRRPVLIHPGLGEVKGAPGQSLMDHAVKTFGWSTPEIWKRIAEAHKEDFDPETINPAQPAR